MTIVTRLRRIVSLTLGLVVPPLQVAAAEEPVLLYENDFESPSVQPMDECATLDQRGIDFLFGSPGGRFQDSGVEAILIHSPRGSYLDPTGRGGNYCLGMLATLNDDRLSLTIDRRSKPYVMVDQLLSAIDVPGCGGPFGVEQPVFHLSLRDGVDGPILDQAEVSWLPQPASPYTFDWTFAGLIFDARGATGNQVTVVWDLLEGGYAALDQLKIEGADCVEGNEPFMPGPADGAVEVPAEGGVLSWQGEPDFPCGGKWWVLFDHDWLCIDVSEPTCPLPRLEPNRTYTWQLMHVADCCLDQMGPEWTFTTGSGGEELRVLASERLSASPTNLGQVRYRVTFSAPVTGVDAGDFAVASDGLSGAAVLAVSGSGAARTVTVRSGSGSGGLRLDVRDNDSILDGDGGMLGGLGSGNGDFLAGESYVIDRVKPTVALATALAVTRLAPIEVLASFSEPVSGFDMDDLAVTGARVIDLEAVDPARYRLHLMPFSAATMVSAQAYAGRSFDAAGNSNQSSNIVRVRFDAVVPEVTSIARQSASPTRLGAVNFVVTFSEPVAGAAVDDFELASTGVRDAAILRVTGSGARRTVVVSTGSGDGSIRLDVGDDDGIADLAGNPLGGDGAGNGGFDQGESYAIDRSRPAVVLSQSGHAAGSPVLVTVTFSEPVSGFDLADLTLSNATAASLTGSGASYQLELRPAGSLRATARILASRAADAAGNVNLASNLLTASIAQ